METCQAGLGSLRALGGIRVWPVLHGIVSAAACRRAPAVAAGHLMGGNSACPCVWHLTNAWESLMVPKKAIHSLAALRAPRWGTLQTPLVLLTELRLVCMSGTKQILASACLMEAHRRMGGQGWLTQDLMVEPKWLANQALIMAQTQKAAQLRALELRRAVRTTGSEGRLPMHLALPMAMDLCVPC